MHNVTAAEAVRNANEILEAMGFKTVVQYNEPQTSAEATWAHAALKTRRREFEGRACANLLDLLEDRPDRARQWARVARWVGYAETCTADAIASLRNSEEVASSRRRALVRLMEEMAAARAGSAGALAIVLEADGVPEQCVEHDVERPAPGDPWIARARAILAEERVS